MKLCTIEGCGRKRLARELCSMHYQRLKNTGVTGGPDPVSQAGENNSNWRGGRVRGGHQLRYWKRHVPDHPRADSCGYVLEHRLVMEETLGRRLRANEIVHHVNHDTLDNRPENLEVMTQSEHASLHNAQARKASA